MKQPQVRETKQDKAIRQQLMRELEREIEALELRGAQMIAERDEREGRVQ